MKIFIFVITFLLSSDVYSLELDPYVLDFPEEDLLAEDKGGFTRGIYDVYSEVTPSSFVNTGFAFFPIFSNVNNESMAGGVSAMYYFRRRNEPPLSRPSYIRSTFIFGEGHYINTGLIFDNYWRNEHHNLYASFNYGRRNACYFEISKKSPTILGTYKASDFNFNLIYRQRFSGKTYIGIIYEFENNRVSYRNPEDVFQMSNVIGLNGGHVSGLGWIWGNLSMDNIFNPQSYFSFEVSNIFYLKYLGSSFDFGKHTIDLRKYYLLWRSHLLALQLHMNFLTGVPPFRHLSRVGDILRAYSPERYVDSHMMILRSEYRALIFSRLVAALFLGLGYHTSRIKTFKLNEYVTSYGGGIRILVHKELNINARIDYAVGKDSKGLFIGIGEAF